LFVTRGFHPSTTPEIARRANVAEGTIYRHFASKDQMLNEIFRGAIGAVAGPLVEVEAHHADCRTRLARVATHWQALAVHDPHLVRLTLVAPPWSDLDTRSRAIAREFHLRVEHLLASGKSSGEIRAGSVDVLADVWLRLTTLTLERIAGGEWTPEHPAARQVTEAAWNAVAAD